MRLRLDPFLSKRSMVALTATLVLALMTGLRVINPDFLNAVRELTFDSYQRFKPRDHVPTPVRVIDIDEASIADVGQWPWPRTKLAEMVDTLTQMGAAAIVFDVVFSEADRTSPHQILKDLPAGTPEDIVTSLRAIPDNDQRFAEAIGQSPVVLGFAVSTESSGRTPAKKAGIAFAGQDPTTILPPYPSALTNLKPLQDMASGIGSISISQVDRDGIIRRVPLVTTDGTNIFPGLTTEALRVAQGASGLIIRTTSASGEQDTGVPAVTEIKIGAFVVPTSAAGELWMYYTPDREDLYIPAKDLFDPNSLNDILPLIEGQIVLVGASAAGLRDIRATSLGELVPGVSIHAQALEQIISQQFLQRPDWADGLEALVTFVVGTIFILGLPAIGSLGTAVLGAAIAAGLIGGSIHLFLQHGLLIDPIYPSVSAFFVFAISTVMLYFLTDREKRFVRQAFSQYLSPDLVTQLEKSPDQLVLGGEIRPMTILFMDIRGFTPISEQLTPTELVSFLNTLLSPLSDAIQDRDGTIDKYIGDSIMAFWNAPVPVPDHAEKACLAGLAMLQVVEELNERDAFQFKARNLRAQTVQIGIGLNSGDACVGNMGSERRFNYSVIGDAVNIASRIESSCKAVGAELLVSDDTRQQAPGFAYLEAGEIPLKGKSEPVKLFALVGDKAHAASSAFLELSQVHERLVVAFQASDVAVATSELHAARQLAPDLDVFYDRFEERLTALKASQKENSAAE